MKPFASFRNSTSDARAAVALATLTDVEREGLRNLLTLCESVTRALQQWVSLAELAVDAAVSDHDRASVRAKAPRARKAVELAAEQLTRIRGLFGLPAKEM